MIQTDPRDPDFDPDLAPDPERDPALDQPEPLPQGEDPDLGPPE